MSNIPEQATAETIAAQRSMQAAQYLNKGNRT
jgi:hypothetical protein